MKDHSKQAPRDIPELTADIEKRLLDLGYSPKPGGSIPSGRLRIWPLAAGRRFGMWSTKSPTL